MMVKLFKALGVVSLWFVNNRGRGSMYCTVGWFDENMGGGSVMESWNGFVWWCGLVFWILVERFCMNPEDGYVVERVGKSLVGGCVGLVWYEACGWCMVWWHGW